MVFGHDKAIRYSLSCIVLVAAPLAALLFGLGLKHYRRTSAESSY